MLIPWLDHANPEFPPIETALSEPEGLLAAGGKLSADTLLKAYRLGIFPWYEAPDPVLWWSPDPRSILEPAEVHISRSMRKLLRKPPFTLSCDRAFVDVMRACAAPRNYTEHTWIGNEMIAAYQALHKAGFAHSIEVWRNDELVGGLYGVAIGCVFCGESMFSNVNNASKFAFIHLCHILKKTGFQFIDCQLESGHLRTLGAKNISRQDFKNRLRAAIHQEPAYSPWKLLSND